MSQANTTSSRSATTPNIQPARAPDVQDFWLSTRKVWLTKALDPFGTPVSSKASVPPDDFLNGEVATSAALARFLAACPPLPGEFLISWDNSSSPPDYVLTNRRLWLRNSKSGVHEDIRLSDVFGWESGSPTADKVSLQLRDKTLLEFDGLATTPIQDLLGLAVRRSTKQHEWEPALSLPGNVPALRARKGFRVGLVFLLIIIGYISSFFLFTTYEPGEEKAFVISGQTVVGVSERYRDFSSGWQQSFWLPMWPVDRYLHTGVEWVNAKPPARVPASK